MKVEDLIDNVPPDFPLIGQTVLQVVDTLQTEVIIIWVDGWTFRFPRNLDVNDCQEYYDQHGG